MLRGGGVDLDRLGRSMTFDLTIPSINMYHAGTGPPKPSPLPGLIGVAYQRREAVAFLMWCVHVCVSSGARIELSIGRRTYLLFTPPNTL